MLRQWSYWRKRERKKGKRWLIPLAYKRAQSAVAAASGAAAAALATMRTNGTSRIFKVQRHAFHKRSRTKSHQQLGRCNRERKPHQPIRPTEGCGCGNKSIDSNSCSSCTTTNESYTARKQHLIYYVKERPHIMDALVPLDWGRVHIHIYTYTHIQHIYIYIPYTYIYTHPHTYIDT